jgi:ATP-binding cassette subfamily F protein uup
LSFADQHALKTSPARIEGLAKEIHRLERLLADPDFYARDRAGFAAAGAELAKAQRELAAAEEEWLRLELLREEIQRPGGLEPMSS